MRKPTFGSYLAANKPLPYWDNILVLSAGQQARCERLVDRLPFTERFESSDGSVVYSDDSGCQLYINPAAPRDRPLVYRGINLLTALLFTTTIDAVRKDLSPAAMAKERKSKIAPRVRDLLDEIGKRSYTPTLYVGNYPLALPDEPGPAQFPEKRVVALHFPFSAD